MMRSTAANGVPADADEVSPPAPLECDAASLLAGLPHACFVLDKNWRFTYANPRAEQLLGRLAGGEHVPLLGRDIHVVCPEVADSTFTKECREALAEQHKVEAETFYPALDRWFAVHVFPAGDHLCVFFQDVTERTQLERQLRRRAEQLAEADQDKDAFLVQLAHEVRNALAPMLTALHLLGLQTLTEADRQAHSLAEREAQRLGRLMTDLLKLSPLAAESPTRERVSVAAVVGQALTGLLAARGLGGRNLTLQLPSEPVWVEGDPNQLEQVVWHLLDNAVKFTSPGGHIHLSAERDGSEVVLSVRDDGVGLEPDMLPQVFNLFMRQGPGRFQGGLGVGLTLVRRLVERHGGSVTAFSDGPNRGSEFVIRLPVLEEPVSAAAAAADQSTEGRQPLRVLVVDDNAEVARGLTLLLARWGCEVRVAYDGPAALETARTWRPELVLLDIGMPGMDGYEVAQRLRQEQGGEGLTLAALTGYGQEEVRGRARAAGFDYHMVKPVDPGVLKDLLTFLKTGAGAPMPLND